MSKFRIVVCVKIFGGELNPFDGAAIASALEASDDVTLLAMSPMSDLAEMRALTRLGVKAVLVSDKSFAGSDTTATSLVLAAAIRGLRPDVVFCGFRSVDGDTAQVPPMLAERLGFGFFGGIVDKSGDTLTNADGEKTQIRENPVYAFGKIRPEPLAGIFSGESDVEVISNADLKLSPDEIGLTGSPTRVVKTFVSDTGRRNCKFVRYDEIFALISAALKRARREKKYESGEKLDEVFCAEAVYKQAAAIAKKRIRIDENAQPSDLAAEIKKRKSAVVLFGDDLKSKTFAARLAVKVGAGLCADCVGLRVEQGSLIMTRPARGQTTTAEVKCVSPFTIATVRTVKDSEDAAFCVGMGAIEYIDDIRALAKRYGAALCCTRPVADGGYLPYSCQVGLTGKSVSPKVYVLFGASGAVQHTCAIENSEVIIAINADKNARIFDYADYGVKEDIKNVKIRP